MPLQFFTLDVFTRTPLTGNPLAVVLDAADLDTKRMQAIANEFNLSETVFIRPPADPHRRASVRIFTPVIEMPFAGHPLIGAAALLALLEPKDAAAQAFGLEAKVGDIACVVERLDENTARTRLRLPKKPQELAAAHGKQALAAAFGLEPGDIGLGRHTPTRFDAGAAYDLIPLRNLDALARARPARPAFDTLFAPPAGLTLLYTEAAPEDDADWRVRMFAPGYGVEEDPATGSAAAAFLGAIGRFAPPGDGVSDIVLRQGVEMGRPSRIGLQLNIAQGVLQHAELIGEAVIISSGTLRT